MLSLLESRMFSSAARGVYEGACGGRGARSVEECDRFPRASIHVWCARPQVTHHPYCYVLVHYRFQDRIELQLLLYLKKLKANKIDCSNIHTSAASRQASTDTSARPAVRRGDHSRTSVHARASRRCCRALSAPSGRSC